MCWVWYIDTGLTHEELQGNMRGWSEVEDKSSEGLQPFPQAQLLRGLLVQGRAIDDLKKL